MMEQGKKAVRVGRLDTVGAVACELGKLYRQARNGRVSVADASRLATVLTALRGCLEVSEIEQRIAALESRYDQPMSSHHEFGADHISIAQRVKVTRIACQHSLEMSRV